LHFEFYQSTSGPPADPANEMDKYFRFGGNVKVESKGETSTEASAAAAGAPTLVIAAGTNNFGDADTSTAKTALKKTISDAQAKGYNVIYIPPNSEGEFSKISGALSEVAQQSGATIEKAQYGTGDIQSRAHFAAGESERIRKKYQGATFMGDSNAAGLGGEKSGMRVTSERMENIQKFTENLKPVSTQSRVQPVPQKQLVASQQLNQYPSYNIQSETVTLIPISQGSNSSPVQVTAGSGGGGMVVMPGPSQAQILNSLFKTMLLTNLSST
jgi:hypothetical protein